MSDLYVVEHHGALSDPFPGPWKKEPRVRSEPMSLVSARKYRDQMAVWHKKPNGTDVPGRFPLEPVILAVSYEETE